MRATIQCVKMRTSVVHERLAGAYHFKKRAQALSRKVEAIELMTTAITELLDAHAPGWAGSDDHTPARRRNRDQLHRLFLSPWLSCAVQCQQLPDQLAFVADE